MQEFAEGYLTDLGMQPADAKAIVEAEKKKSHSGMDSIYWSYDTTCYAPLLLAGLQTTFRNAGHAWMKKNCPNASDRCLSECGRLKLAENQKFAWPTPECGRP
jgi:hypothetical protein